MAITIDKRTYEPVTQRQLTAAGVCNPSRYHQNIETQEYSLREPPTHGLRVVTVTEPDNKAFRQRMKEARRLASERSTADGTFSCETIAPVVSFSLRGSPSVVLPQWFACVTLLCTRHRDTPP